MPDLAYVNGIIGPLSEAMVSVEDRGYQFGDAVYEVVASYGGKLFCLETHLERLKYSMAALSFPKLSIDRLREAALTLLKKSEIPRAALYIQISRGVAQRNHAFPPNPVPQVIMTVRSVHEVSGRLKLQGAHVITCLDERWGRCDIKSVQLVANLLIKQKALDAGVDDALFVDETGVVREGSSSNIFMVSKGMLSTHPLTPRILSGVTRGEILSVCREEGDLVIEGYFNKDDLYAADEAFLTGTITEVLPVTIVDGQPIGTGKPGPVTRRLQAAYHKRIGATS